MLPSFLFIVVLYFFFNPIRITCIKASGAQRTQRLRFAAAIQSDESFDTAGILVEDTQLSQQGAGIQSIIYCRDRFNNSSENSSSRGETENFSQEFELARIGVPSYKSDLTIQVCTRKLLSEEIELLTISMIRLLNSAKEVLDSTIPSSDCKNTCATCDCTEADRKLIVVYKHPKRIFDGKTSFGNIISSAKKIVRQHTFAFDEKELPSHDFHTICIDGSIEVINSVYDQSAENEKTEFQKLMRKVQRLLVMAQFYLESLPAISISYNLSKNNTSLINNTEKFLPCRGEQSSLFRTFFLDSLHMEIIELPKFINRELISSKFRAMEQVLNVYNDFSFNWETGVEKTVAEHINAQIMAREKLAFSSQTEAPSQKKRTSSLNDDVFGSTQALHKMDKRDLPDKPNDPYFSSQWALLQKSPASMNFIGAWPQMPLFEDTPKIAVAVIDSGLELTHKDFKGKIWVNVDEIQNNGIDDDNNGYIDDINGWDFATNSPVLEDKTGHGTKVSGIIAAATNNNVGIASPCPTCEIMVLKVTCKDLNEVQERTSMSTFLKAIDYALQKKVKVCNMSVSLDNPMINHALFKAGTADMIVVASAGNSNKNLDLRKNARYPASSILSNVVTVASVDKEGELSRTSNYGSNSVLIAAPGAAISTTDLEDAYELVWGTSFAAPHVTSLIAYMRSIKPQCPHTRIIKMLINRGKNLASLSGKTRTGKVISFKNVFVSLLLESGKISVEELAAKNAAESSQQTIPDQERITHDEFFVEETSEFAQ